MIKFLGSRKVLSLGLSITGVAVLSFIVGAAVIAYQLPTADSLLRAFNGARHWQERDNNACAASGTDESPFTKSAVDVPGKSFDGFTLYTCVPDRGMGTQAFLVDMQCREVHRWSVRFSDIWGKTVRTQSAGITVNRQIDDRRACIFGTYLYPNGDLLAVFHGPDEAYHRLAKLDKDSNVLWAQSAPIHHDVDVGEDGTIYAIQQELVDRMPAGLEGITTPCQADYLIRLSPDGKVLGEPISILTALRDSSYGVLLANLELPPKRREPPAGSTAPRINHLRPETDALHTNCVRVLRSDLAARFPGFKAGQVLISVRNLSVVAMLDVETRSVVWAARGPWLAQHDPQFLENGNLLIFDNLGSPKGSRVLEYDVRTQAVPWSYTGRTSDGFYTSERGMSQRLPNGNTFVVDSEGGELVEVTPAKEVVWACSLGRFVTTARRYSAEELSFLGPDVQPRP